jgi:hypothetical protein
MREIILAAYLRNKPDRRSICLRDTVANIADDVVIGEIYIQ